MELEIDDCMKTSRRVHAQETLVNQANFAIKSFTSMEYKVHPLKKLEDGIWYYTWEVNNTQCVGLVWFKIHKETFKLKKPNKYE